MNIILLFLAVISFLTGFALSRLKKILFDMENSPEMVIQAERCFKYNFSTSSQDGKISWPSTKGCSIYKNKQGKIILFSQIKPDDSSIL